MVAASPPSWRWLRAVVALIRLRRRHRRPFRGCDRRRSHPGGDRRGPCLRTVVGEVSGPGARRARSSPKPKRARLAAQQTARLGGPHAGRGGARRGGTEGRNTPPPTRPRRGRAALAAFRDRRRRAPSPAAGPGASPGFQDDIASIQRGAKATLKPTGRRASSGVASDRTHVRLTRTRRPRRYSPAEEDPSAGAFIPSMTGTFVITGGAPHWPSS